MQAAALLSQEGAIHDERRHRNEIPQFQQVRGDLETPVKLLNLALEIPQALIGLNCIGENAEAGDGDFDAVAGFEWSYAGGRAGEQQVTRLERED